MIEFGNIRVAVYSDTLFRIEYQPERQFLDKPTLLMGNTLPQEIVPLQVQRQDDTLVIQTQRCTLTYQKLSREFGKDPLEFKDRLEVRFQCGDLMKFWTPETKHSPGIPEISRSLDEWWPNTAKRYPVQSIVNRDGWQRVCDNAGAYWDEKTQWPMVSRPPYYENWYLFFYGDQLTRGFQDILRLLGPAPLLPRHTFGSWYSRWYPFQQQELLDLVAEYQKHQLPLDVLVVDVDWHKDHWNGYDWDLRRFPDPSQFIQKIRQMGMKLVLNDHPGYDQSDPLPEQDTHLQKIKENLTEAPYRGMWACDWSRKSVVSQWITHCLQDILKQGIDWWWIDGWTDTPFPGVDSQFWINWLYYQATQELQPKQRVLILSRWGGLGSHRYPVQFSGDTHATLESISTEVTFTAYAGAIGANYWSHDIGGFHEGTIDEEVYIRWVQFGALTTIFRTHSNHGIREPFLFSPKALQIYRQYIELRYRMLPYWEHLNFVHHLTGFPPIAAMEFVWSQNIEMCQAKDQYMIGQSLLVAPITQKISPATQTASKVVLLPPGNWLNTMTGKWEHGNQQMQVQASLEHIPIWVRHGSVILSGSMMSPITNGPYQELTLHIFNSNIAWEASQTFFLSDGITSSQYDPDLTTRLTIECHQKNNALSITLYAQTPFTYLPQQLHLVVYPNTNTHHLLIGDGKEYTLSPSIHGLFENPAIPCLSWTVPGATLQQTQNWELRF